MKPPEAAQVVPGRSPKKNLESTQWLRRGGAFLCILGNKDKKIVEISPNSGARGGLAVSDRVSHHGSSRPQTIFA